MIVIGSIVKEYKMKGLWQEKPLDIGSDRQLED